MLPPVSSHPQGVDLLSWADALALVVCAAGSRCPHHLAPAVLQLVCNDPAPLAPLLLKDSATSSGSTAAMYGYIGSYNTLQNLSAYS